MVDDVSPIHRMQDDEGEDFAEIFRRYYARIYNYVYRLLGDADEAQDVTQESFLKAYRALSRSSSQGDSPTNVLAWLYRIASNTSLDVLRRRQRIRWEPLEGLLAILRGGGRSPEEEVIYADKLAAVERVLAELPPRYRMMLLLREREGFSYREIAAITGDSLDTVKVTLYRARERAREIASQMKE